MFVTEVTRASKAGGVLGCLRRLLKAKDAAVLVGITRDKAKRDPKDGRSNDMNNAQLLRLHTYGSPKQNIPARPVLRPAIKAHNKELSTLMGRVVTAAKNADANATEKALLTVGVAAKGYCQEWFVDPRNNWAPNAPATIRRKHSDSPLIDTGHLRQSIDFKIEER